MRAIVRRDQTVKVFLFLILAAVAVRAAEPAIVEAKVQSLDPELEGSTLVARMVVTQVYAGPAGLVGRSFLAQTSDSGHGGSHGIIRPALRVGENGLWVVRETGERLGVVTSDFRSRSWPVIEGRELGFGRLRQELRVERELGASAAMAKAAEPVPEP